MKKSMVVFMVLILSTASFSQQINPSPALTKQDYLKKSNNNTFMAWTFLGGGAIALALAGIDLDFCVFGCTKNTFSPAAAGIGAVCIAVSIPFFISSAKNKRRARSVSFRNEMIPQLQNGIFVNRSVPSLTLIINL